MFYTRLLVCSLFVYERKLVYTDFIVTMTDMLCLGSFIYVSLNRELTWENLISILTCPSVQIHP